MKRLHSMTPPDRRAHAMQAKLCFNCLKTGHTVAQCRANPQCDQCPGRHHPMLHARGQPGSHGIVSYSCQTDSQRPPVRLMTAVGEVQGETLRAKVRVFVDLSSQASFVSSALVHAVRPPKVGCHRMTVRSFDAKDVEAEFGLYKIRVTGLEGRTHVVRAYEKPDLDLRIGPVPDACVQRWQSRGVKLSDQENDKVPTEPHLLVGADAANSLLTQKCQFEGEFVWKSELGWVLSGPGHQLESPPPGGSASRPTISVVLVQLSAVATHPSPRNHKL